MSVLVQVPEDLRRYCGGEESVELAGRRVGELLCEIAERYPELALRVLDEQGALRSHLVVIRNEEVLPREGLSEQAVSPGDDLRIYTAVSGG